jgi:Transglutaminase-like superfamily
VSASTADSKPASRLRALASLLASPSDTWLAIRTVGWMYTLPLLKRVLPLPRLVHLMWRPARASERDLERELRTAHLVRRLCRTSGGNCLERSLILYRYLARANADPRLVVGMGKPDEFLGHVWVTVDGRPLLDSPETLRGYTEVVRFGDDGAQEA